MIFFFITALAIIHKFCHRVSLIIAFILSVEKNFKSPNGWGIYCWIIYTIVIINMWFSHIMIKGCGEAYPMVVSNLHS